MLICRHPGRSLISSQVRTQWTTGLSEARWGQFYRARCHLRRELGREPTQDEVESVEEDFKSIAIEPAQFEAAFVAGQEVRWSELVFHRLDQ